MAKRGRPKKDGSMKRQFNMFMDDKFDEDLETVSSISGMTKSDIMRKSFYESEFFKKFGRFQACDYEKFMNYDESDDLDG